MKINKILLLLLCMFLLVGCGNNTNNDILQDSSINSEDNLVDPEIKWCKLYNPNGSNTITCILSNPNKEPIDVYYDLVFYKNGNEVSRTDGYANFYVSPDKDELVWGNYNLPKESEVDEIKMENIEVYKSSYKAIKSEFKYIETKNNKAFFSVKNDNKPGLNSIWFLLYNDNNKNGKCDKDEVVVVNSQSTTEKEDTVYFETDVYNYTDYEIYYNGYYE